MKNHMTFAEVLYILSEQVMGCNVLKWIWSAEGKLIFTATFDASASTAACVMMVHLSLVVSKLSLQTSQQIIIIFSGLFLHLFTHLWLSDTARFLRDIFITVISKNIYFQHKNRFNHKSFKSSNWIRCFKTNSWNKEFELRVNRRLRSSQWINAEFIAQMKSIEMTFTDL